MYADHQAADEATCHIPAVLRWPGLTPRTVEGLLYHLDIGATVVELAGLEVPVDHWDGRSVAGELRAGDTSVGRDHLVVSQGAWSCQRSVRWGDHLYTCRRATTPSTAGPTRCSSTSTTDPHEQHDLAATRPDLVDTGRDLLASWTSDQLARSFSPADPMDVVMAEGGPFHCRGELPAYLDRLRTTGRGEWADRLAERRPRLAGGPHDWMTASTAWIRPLAPCTSGTTIAALVLPIVPSSLTVTSPPRVMSSSSPSI